MPYGNDNVTIIIWNYFKQLRKYQEEELPGQYLWAEREEKGKMRVGFSIEYDPLNGAFFNETTFLSWINKAKLEEHAAY